jgi:hypothetical protein
MKSWSIDGREFVTCNCDWGCPCQFNARPTRGSCEAVVGIAIDKGRFEDVPLDGLRVVGVFKWPGAIHEGRGKALLVIDERASPAQREALLTILSGQETEPGATIFNVFASTYEEVLDPQFKPIDLDIDIEERTGRIGVQGVVEATGRPIINPVTGKPHRARVELPQGFEYSVAEFASGSSTVRGRLAFELNDRHAHFCRLDITQSGVVR